MACGAPQQDTGKDSGSAVPQTAEEAATRQVDPVQTSSGATRVLILGTSLTAGYGLDNPDDSYPSVMQRMADSAGYRISVQNAGLSGETSAGALRRVGWVLRDTFDVVVIETGANDGLRGLDVDSTRANLRGIIREVRTRLPQAKVALVQMEAPPNLGGPYTTRFHDSFGVIAREEGIALLPFLLDGVAGVTSLNQRDGIHPNPEGARLAAANMWKALQPLVAEVRAGG